MNTYSDEQESQLFEGDEKVLVHCYSVVGKVLAADLVNVDKLRNHFLIGATALGRSIAENLMIWELMRMESFVKLFPEEGS